MPLTRDEVRRKLRIAAGAARLVCERPAPIAGALVQT